MPEGRLVYSTEQGDQRGDRRKDERAAPVESSGGPVRVWREKGGRKGKTVTIVRGLPKGDLGRVAADLKKLCGAGGAVKDGAVEIQGDHREKIVVRLVAQGFDAKPAGG